MRLEAAEYIKIMTRKEFKEKLFSYCQLLGFIITKHSVEFKPFGTLFLFSPYDDTFNYTPIPPKGKAPALRKIKINYNEGTLEIYKLIAKKWHMLYKEYEIKKKVDGINKDFE